MILAKIIIAMATEKMIKLKYEAQDCTGVQNNYNTLTNCNKVENDKI